MRHDTFKTHIVILPSVAQILGAASVDQNYVAIDCIMSYLKDSDPHTVSRFVNDLFDDYALDVPPDCLNTVNRIICSVQAHLGFVDYIDIKLLDLPSCTKLEIVYYDGKHR